MARKINQAGEALIRGTERLRLEAYADPGTGGKPWTIGWGRAHGVNPGDRCTLEQAEQWFHDDLEWAEDAVSKLCQVPLNDNEFSALVSLVYNIGTNEFRQSKVLKYVNAGLFIKVPGFMMEYDHSAGHVMPGLIKRRRAECELWSTGSLVTPRTSPTAASKLRAGSFLFATPAPTVEQMLPREHATLKIPFDPETIPYWHGAEDLPQTPMPPLPEDLRVGFLTRAIAMGNIKGWRTLAFFLATGILGLLQTFQWINIFPDNPQLVGGIVSGLSMAGMILRTMTSTPVGSK